MALAPPIGNLPSLPRWLRWLATAFSALALTTLFALWLFPYERLARVVSERVRDETGIVVDPGAVEPTLGLHGIGLRAGPVRIAVPGERVVLLPSVALRPAWSSSWLSGDPAFVVDVEGGASGTASGLVRFGDTAALSGELHEFELALLPVGEFAENLDLGGRASGRIDLARDAQGRPLGRIDLVAADGHIGHPSLPVAIPFATLRADLTLDDEHLLQIETLTLDGPALDARATGQIGRTPQPGSEPLRLSVELTPVGDDMAQTLRDLGVRLGAQGRGRIQVAGTLANPSVRR